MPRRIVSLAVASLLSLGVSLLGADPPGVAVRGVVEDPAGESLAGARVTLSAARGRVRDAVSDAEGYFVIGDVEPGDYILVVEAKTLRPFDMPLQVTTQAPRPVKIKMMLGLAEEVSVTGVRPEEERTASAANADLLDFDDRSIQALPSGGRAQDLMNLVANFVSPAATGTGGVSVLVDGVAADDLTMPGMAIDHIRINRNPHSPEFRRPGRGRVEVETQDGSRRRFHGGVGISYRNSAFESKNALSKTKTDLDRKFFELSFSGPIGQRAGSFFLGAEREATDEEAIVNAQTLGGPLNVNVPVKDRFTSALAHVDLRFGLHKVKAKYSFSHEPWENRGVGGFQLPEQAIDGTRGPKHSAQVSVKNIFSTSYVNDFLLAVVAQDRRTGSPATGPTLKVNGAFIGGPSQSDSVNHGFKVEAREVGTYVRGAHTVRFGGGFAHRSVAETEASGFGGLFEFASLEDFARGTPYVFRVNQGDPRLSYSFREAEAFVQDEVRLGNDLRLMLGARYDWQSVIDDHDNVAPRLSLAYAPGSQKTVFRGGAGLFYEELATAVIGRRLLYDGERVRTLVITDPSYPDPLREGNAALVPASVFRLAPDLRTPYLFQTTLAVEHHLAARHQLTLEYGYLRGFHLFRARDVNAPLPETGLPPDPTRGNVLQVESTGKLRSHALTVTYRGHIHSRLRATAQYTLGIAKNDVRGGEVGDGFSDGVPANNYDVGPEWGPADFDRRHRFNATLVAYLPRMINFGAVLTRTSPPPFDITTGSDDNGDGYAKDRPPGVTRNTGHGPDYFQLDVRLSKAWAVYRPLRRGEARNGQVELAVDAFNLTNRTNYDSYVGVITSPFFGRANAAKAGRRVQFALRYTF